MNAARILQLKVFMFLDEVVEIRLVLEKVRVKFLVVKRDIRLNVIIELDDLKIDSLFLEVGLNLFQNFGVRSGRRANFQSCLGTCRRFIAVSFRGSVAAAATRDKKRRRQRQRG